MNRTEHQALVRRVEALEGNGAERHAPEPQILALQAAIRTLGERMERMEEAMIETRQTLLETRNWVIAAKSEAAQGHGFAESVAEGTVRRLDAIEAELKRRRGGRPPKPKA